jgi:hypothetical protein
VLHYSGDKLALELGEVAKDLIQIYGKPARLIDQTGETVFLSPTHVEVPFYDLQRGRIRHAKFEWLAEQWVFTDLTG